MTQDVRKTLPSDVDSICERLSEQNWAEIRNVGWTLETMKLRLLAFIGRGYSDTLWFDGKPQCLLAVAHDNLFGPVTWFIASKEYFADGVHALKWTRKYLKDAANTHGTLTTISCSKNPATVRWFKLLGYTHVQSTARAEVFLLEK